MEIEKVLRIEGKEVEELPNVSINYNLYKTKDGETIYFANKSVRFKIDKNLQVTKFV